MREPIKAGDLVYVAHTCCDKQPSYGLIREVMEINSCGSVCGECGYIYYGFIGRIDSVPGHGCIPLPWLKKLEGKPDPESIERETDAPRERVFIDRKKGIVA